MSVIPALRRLRHEEHEFKASLGYIAGLHLKKEEKKKNEKEREYKIINTNPSPPLYS
jgi:hypothetical protein